MTATSEDMRGYKNMWDYRISIIGELDALPYGMKTQFLRDQRVLASNVTKWRKTLLTWKRRCARLNPDELGVTTINEETESSDLTAAEWEDKARKLTIDNAVMATCDHYQKMMIGTLERELHFLRGLLREPLSRKRVLDENDPDVQGVLRTLAHAPDILVDVKEETDE